MGAMIDASRAINRESSRTRTLDRMKKKDKKFFVVSNFVLAFFCGTDTIMRNCGSR